MYKKSNKMGKKNRLIWPRLYKELQAKENSYTAWTQSNVNDPIANRWDQQRVVIWRPYSLDHKGFPEACNYHTITIQ